jgi:hypothetical protein
VDVVKLLQLYGSVSWTEFHPQFEAIFYSQSQSKALFHCPRTCCTVSLRPWQSTATGQSGRSCIYLPSRTARLLTFCTVSLQMQCMKTLLRCSRTVMGTIDCCRTEGRASARQQVAGRICSWHEAPGPLDPCWVT